MLISINGMHILCMEFHNAGRAIYWANDRLCSVPSGVSIAP